MVSRLVQKAVIFNDNGEVLMLRRSKTDVRRPLQWDLPGGMREEGEELLDSVKREILEETGLKVDKVIPVYSRSEIRKWKTQEGGHAQNVVFLFYVARTSIEKVKISYEHDKAQWKSLKEAIDEFEYPLHREALSHIDSHDLAKSS